LLGDSEGMGEYNIYNRTDPACSISYSPITYSSVPSSLLPASHSIDLSGIIVFIALLPHIVSSRYLDFVTDALL
jgi:hypothetical protein